NVFSRSNPSLDCSPRRFVRNGADERGVHLKVFQIFLPVSIVTESEPGSASEPNALGSTPAVHIGRDQLIKCGQILRMVGVSRNPCDCCGNTASQLLDFVDRQLFARNARKADEFTRKEWGVPQEDE